MTGRGRADQKSKTAGQGTKKGEGREPHGGPGDHPRRTAPIYTQGIFTRQTAGESARRSPRPRRCLARYPYRLRDPDGQRQPVKIHEGAQLTPCRSSARLLDGRRPRRSEREPAPAACLFGDVPGTGPRQRRPVKIYEAAQRAHRGRGERRADPSGRMAAHVPPGSWTGTEAATEGREADRRPVRANVRPQSAPR